MTRGPSREAPVATSLDQLVERARTLATSAPRRLLGITGPPGAGKSFVADAIATVLAGDVAIAGMDGFHLANSELERLGRRERKGAPDTFDGAGYVALLRRLREPARELVYAPRYEREIEEAIAAAVAIAPEVPLIVTEGNYLLLDSAPWADIRGLLDEAWFCDPDTDVRLSRLVARHEAYGKTPHEARAWASRPDEDNARLVAATRSRADLVVRLESDVP